jgi:uncharacterized membrane protein
MRYSSLEPEEGLKESHKRAGKVQYHGDPWRMVRDGSVVAVGLRESS